MALVLLRSAIREVKEKGLRAALREAKDSGLFLNHPAFRISVASLSALTLTESVAKRVLVDGNYANSRLRLDAKLVGVDKDGNQYYEKMDGTQYGRHRWVVYADKDYNASAIPPEWHGWLHNITDHTAEQLQGLKPSRYGLEHTRNRSGEGEEYIYHSKGHALNPHKRDWKRYEPWQPAENDA